VKKPDKDLPHLIFDYEGLLERVEHDRELLRDLLAIFKQGFPPQLLACAKRWRQEMATASLLLPTPCGACSPILRLPRQPPQPLASSRWAARKRLWAIKKPSVYSRTMPASSCRN